MKNPKGKKRAGMGFTLIFACGGETPCFMWRVERKDHAVVRWTERSGGGPVDQEIMRWSSDGRWSSGGLRAQAVVLRWTESLGSGESQRREKERRESREKKSRNAGLG
ncbi:hypothetical protein L484_024610 [Morus notabilis]|uniref:Uncharacterized protein n=1 Tax=Morus notabilis TaxID=981085 RepID=W9QRY4_9ROSA|nr:hypothetical protein L484_024610 [Morus notabilis]